MLTPLSICEFGKVLTFLDTIRLTLTRLFLEGRPTTRSINVV